MKIHSITTHWVLVCFGWMWGAVEGIIHLARHTFGTLNLLENSDKILLVSKLLSHADIKTTMVYFNGTKKLIDDHAKNGSQIFSGNKLK